MKIRLATLNDLNEIYNCFDIAKKKMRNDGNMYQWEEGYPHNYVINDIKNNNCYLIINDHDEISASFTMIDGIEPTYLRIDNGKWLNDKPYVTIHRIASNNKMKDIFHIAINYAKKLNKDIRIDTSVDNKRMMHLIEKEGFIYTGIIYIRDGSPRLAYQLINK